MKSDKNIAASVRQRLLNVSKNNNRPFNEFLQYYAMERFLYRLSRSKQSKLFVLKGALMLRVWHCSEYRPTMDIDMLGRTPNSEENIIFLIKDILKTDIINDGIIFDFDSINTQRITENANYEGIRVKFTGSLGTAKIHLHIDIGFGDTVYPKPVKETLPATLDFPAPELYCYSKESAIAEKFEAMIKLGVLNSRVKDFYDIWLLSRQFGFSLSMLANAVNQTFSYRGTYIILPIDAFSDKFIRSRQTNWQAFRKRLNLSSIPESFSEVVNEIKVFLGPIIDKKNQEMKWTPVNHWKK